MGPARDEIQKRKFKFPYWNFPYWNLFIFDKEFELKFKKVKLWLNLIEIYLKMRRSQKIVKLGQRAASCIYFQGKLTPKDLEFKILNSQGQPNLI
jgi:hypothetical protein